MQHFIFYTQNYFIIYIPTCMYYENSKYLTSFVSLPKTTTTKTRYKPRN